MLSSNTGAAPISYTEQFQTAVTGGDDINTGYTNITEYGDNLFGTVGAEDNPNHAGGADGDIWLFFQSGNNGDHVGGSEAGVRIELGQQLTVADGDTIQVDFWLSQKVNNSGAERSYTDAITVALTDGPAGPVVAATGYTPIYDTAYSAINGSTLSTGVTLPTYIADTNDNQLVDQVSLIFSGLSSDTTNNLFLDLLFQQDSERFAQGNLNNLAVIQVPEPGSTALLGIGGLCMAWRRRH